MNAAGLLDLLGNENRRRILQLLAHKPCYVTEISEQLGVSPKAVIEHLRKLEDAGLVESHVDDRRRKYFHIARSLRLEVSVSPYRFGAKSAYPGSFDLTRCRHVSIDVDTARTDGAGVGPRSEPGRSASPPEDTDPDAADPSALATRLDRLDELEDELSLAQRWVQAQLTETIERVGEVVGEELDERLYAETLLAVSDGAHTPAAVAERVGTGPDLAREALTGLAEAGFLRRDDGQFRLAE
jgi:ArsR family transcriptional regulator